MELPEKIKRNFVLFGENVKMLREERNMTLKELSQKTGMRVEYLKKIEQGSAYGMRICTHVVKLAKAFNVPVSLMFRFDNK